MNEVLHAWFGMLLGLTGIGALVAVILRMIGSARGGLR